MLASLVVVLAGQNSCFYVATRQIPPPGATTDSAQNVLERFVVAASRSDTPSMSELLTGEAARTLDEKVLLAISEYVKSNVSTVAGFQKTDQQVLKSGSAQRLYIGGTAGGLTGKARVRAILVYKDDRWLIEAIEIR